jgi:hypothetical protein
MRKNHTSIPSAQNQKQLCMILHNKAYHLWKDRETEKVQSPKFDMANDVLLQNLASLK